MAKFAMLRCSSTNMLNKRSKIMWSKPEVTEMRFGFEVTMYVMNK